MSHAPLHPDTRNLLAREILKAREAAEAGAKASLAALRIGEASPAEGMSAQERSLRNRLRANGRQHGDLLLADGKQELGSLVEEIAYQHWHRMLFARFLAENGLLREDQGDQPIDLAECEALANDEGLDVWAYAARCAQKMLPGVFRVDDPKLELRLDTPKQLELNAILKALPSQVFTATDALGWVYQYWQAKRKDEVNASGVKIGAKELSPVTQLFTEDYMVDFLLHNTLGAWWAGKIGPIEAATEEEARTKAGLPAKNGLPAVVWTYLRFAQDAETKKWTPASGTFDGWPKKAKDITFLDPCMGSGHFPVFALPILARMRMEEERGTGAENIHSVLKDQIHGLELDQRCCQIGAFNIALTAWKLAGFQQLPALNTACCGIAPRAKLDEWVKLAANDEKLKLGMSRLHGLFELAPVLGSLVNPEGIADDLFAAGYKELRPLLEAALSTETQDDAAQEMAVAARGVALAAGLLTKKYTLVATNVPYLGRKKFTEQLRVYLDANFETSRYDLATAFVERIHNLLVTNGTQAIVSPQSWLYLSAFSDFRRNLLTEFGLGLVARLGAKSFQTPMWDFNICLFTLSKSAPSSASVIKAIDCAQHKGALQKAKALIETKISSAIQLAQLKNPDNVITEEGGSETDRLSSYATVFEGAKTVDIERFRKYCWEFPSINQSKWAFHSSAPDVQVDNSNFSGGIYVSANRSAGGEFFANISYCESIGVKFIGWECGKPCWGKLGISLSPMAKMPASLYLGSVFDNSSAVIIPKEPSDRKAVYLFLRSEEFKKSMRAISQALQVAAGSIGNVPFNFNKWKELASAQPDSIVAPASYSPREWIFDGDIKLSEQPLQVGVARLLCYKWPRQTGSSFPDCPALGPDGLEVHADDDGIVALIPINREEAAATRVRALLKSAYGAEWQDGITERQLLADAGHGGVTLEDWLRDSFFEEHCKLFHHRPFIWHIWDGEKDGFHVLVNYHRLAAGNGDGTRLLQKLATTYLGDWIARCNQEVAAEKPGAARRLKAAQDLQADLRKILEGEAPNDIFVRWKPLHEQAIGWAPDINDGVRLNIRPFLTVRDVGKKGAGLLRFKPNVKWDKDRGKEPQRPKSDFPWFWSCDPETNPQHVTDFTGGSSFSGERWNDLHFTLDAKKAARTKKA